MARGRVSSRLRRAAAVMLVVALTGLTACSHSVEEPGLFGRTDPSPAPSAFTSPGPGPVPSGSHQAVNPELPVVGEAVWRSADGRDVQLRLAVHAVRRIRGATVLDWSVTPLGAPGLRPGDPLPVGTRLGLARYGPGELNLFLVDAPGHRVYRPLTARDPAQQQGCLCSPLGAAERSLRIGRTTLLQVAYPELPDATATIDVDITTVPMFSNVPVTPVGQVPRATNPTDLARAADATPLTTTSKVFRYGPSGQRFLVSVDSVLASSRFTSLSWTIQSVTAGPGLDAVDRPPFAAAPGAAGRAVNVAAASGPRLLWGRPARSQPARLMTARLVGPDLVECLCSDLRLWASGLRSPAQRATVVTNLPPLPIGTERVDVAFPGLARVTDVPVTSAADATVLSAAPVPARAKTWTYRYRDPVPGWPLDQWPTPVPDRSQLERYRATVEQLIR